jgi:uncharacterized glyoxalase superfamily protein PhnB
MVKRPERYRNAIVPHIYVDGAADGIAFYKRAFGAEELFRIPHPNGKILHSQPAGSPARQLTDQVNSMSTSFLVRAMA